MALKPNGDSITLREQIIEDEVTGITIQIERTPSGEGRIRLWGDIPHGNREFQFNEAGEEVGAGTFLQQPVRPNWLRDVSAGEQGKEG